MDKKEQQVAIKKAKLFEAEPIYSKTKLKNEDSWFGQQAKKLKRLLIPIKEIEFGKKVSNKRNSR